MASHADPQIPQPPAPERAPAEGDGVTGAGLGPSPSGGVHVVLPSLDADLWTLVDRLTSALRGHFARVALWPTDDTEAAQVTLIESLPAQEPVVVIPARRADGGLAEVLRRRVAVAVGQVLPSGRFDTLVVENYRAGYLAAKHLVNLGHRRIAYVGPAPGATSVDERLRGFRQALVHNGRQVGDDLIGLASEPGAVAAACEKLWQHPQPPTALFAAGETVAVAAVQALERLSVRIPHDVALVAFGDGPLVEAVRPKLTAVVPPYGQLAARAAARVAELAAAGVPAGQRRCEPERLPARLVIRDSCGVRQQVRVQD